LKRERSRKHRLLQVLRIATQTGFFSLFVYLFAVSHYTGQDYIGRTVERFFHFDPLIALTTFFASRAFFASLALAGVTVLLTLVLGRVVCGWVCPLGAVHQFFSFVFKKAKFLRPKKEEKASVSWKYAVLVFVLVSAVFTLNVVGVLDPLSLLYRSFGISIFPGLARIASGFVGLLYGLHVDSVAQAISQFVDNLMLNATFRQGFLIMLIFAGIVALNAWKERFWCRYVCPLGALLGVFSRLNVFKLRIDEERCIKCGLCTTHCETQAVPYPNDKWRSAECVYCETCAAICPTAAITFPAKVKPEGDVGVRTGVKASVMVWVTPPEGTTTLLEYCGLVIDSDPPPVGMLAFSPCHSYAPRSMAVCTMRGLPSRSVGWVLEILMPLSIPGETPCSR